MTPRKKTAPACLIVNFCRPALTKLVIDAVETAGFDGPLYLFADGPRDSKTSRKNCAKVRELLEETRIAREKLGKKTKILTSPTNLGCKMGPAHAIAWVFRENEKAHILEDDIIPHPNFFKIHGEALETFEDHPALWLAEGHPLPNCPVAWLETRMARLIGWSSWRHKAAPYFTIEQLSKPFPWRENKTGILQSLHLKTKIHLWKEFERLEIQPERWWHYPVLEHQLLQNKTGLTPTARLHNNIGIDGSGGNCLNLYGATESWEEDQVTAFQNKKHSVGKEKTWERKMETQRYGRLRQAIGKKLYAITPQKWKKCWKPVHFDSQGNLITVN